MSKAVLITGGGRGIGRAVAILAGQRGWAVGVNYRGNERAALETVREVERTGGSAVAIKGDVADEADVVAMTETLVKAFGRYDVLINNAGIVAPIMPLVEMTAERMRRLFDVNVLGAFLCAREAARRMARSKGGNGGVIVNLSSVAARLGSPGEFVDYAGSKGAIDSMTLGLARELGPEGIRVNAVRPGLIDTEIHVDANFPDRAVRFGKTVPLGRAGLAEEVAQAIIWLADDAASYVTGAVLDVSGGR